MISLEEFSTSFYQRNGSVHLLEIISARIEQTCLFDEVCTGRHPPQRFGSPESQPKLDIAEFFVRQPLSISDPASNRRSG